MKPGTCIFILSAVVLALAAAVRFADLGARPMHADEAVQTQIFSDLLEQGDYRYDPAHYHGPLPHFINLPLLRALGVRSLDTLQAWQFRLQPALAGLLLVLLAGVCAGGGERHDRKKQNLTPSQKGSGFAFCGRSAWWRAMLLAAVSPTLVYFSRMAIHETLLAVCALAVPFAVARWLEGREEREGREAGKMFWLLAAAVAFGCMFATKETWSVIAFSWAVAALVLWPKKTWLAVRGAGAWRLALAVAVAMAVSFLLYSNFGRRPEGFADAWRALFAYRTGGGHEKSWWYFLADCLGFYRAGGWVAGEGVICLLAIAGGVGVLLRPFRALFSTHANPGSRGLDPGLTSGTPLACKPLLSSTNGRIPPLPLFLAVSGAAQVVVYSIIKYKTPWLMLVPLASFVPLAAHGWAWLQGRLRSPWWSAVFMLAVVPGMVVPMKTSSFTEPTNTDFRFVYAPTLPEADAQLARVAAALPADAMVAVIGDDYWPLPWYFRARRGRVGYFSDAAAPPPAELRAFALVIHAGYQLDPAVTGPGWRVLELRPGYFVSVPR